MSQSILFGPGDYAPSHKGYVELVHDKDLHKFLPFQGQRFSDMMRAVPEEKADYAYAPGKWTIKQVVQHINDAERIFGFRLLVLSRGEHQAIPAFDQDDYANFVDVSHRTIRSLISEFDGIRRTTIDLFESLTPESLRHRGKIDRDPVLAAALPFIIAGHAEHHIRILSERYGL